MQYQEKVDELLSSRSSVTLIDANTNRKRSKVRLWLPLAVLALALVFLITKGLGNSLVYFHTVDEAIAMRASLGSTTFRLEGVVVGGTVHTNSQGGVNFFIRGADGKEIYIKDSANPPELFQPNLAVVLVGNFSGMVFMSDQIMVKHSATYIAAHPNRVSTLNGKKL